MVRVETRVHAMALKKCTSIIKEEMEMSSYSKHIFEWRLKINISKKYKVQVASRAKKWMIEFQQKNNLVLRDMQINDAS